MSDPGITVTRKRGFTVVYNDLLPEGRISARAWGLYVYLVGRPDGWECRVSHLRNVFTEGRDAIYTALGELVNVGLMDRQSYVETKTNLRRVRYSLNADQPVRNVPDPDSQEPGAPDAGTPDPDSQDPDKPRQVSKEGTSTDQATTDSTTDGPAGPSGGVEQRNDRPDVARIVEHLSQRLTEHGVNHNPNQVAWRDAARLMLDTDGRTETQVHNMIDWCQKSSFWAPNIHSVPTLREKYDRMRQQALRETTGGTVTRLPTSPEAEATVAAKWDQSIASGSGNQ